MFGMAFGGPGPLLLLLLAVTVDAVFGDWLDRVLPDPARLAFRFCNAADARLNRIQRGATDRLLRGALVVLVVILLAALAGLAVEWVGGQGRGWLLELLALLCGLRGRAAWTKVRAVRRALEKGGASAGQEAIQGLTRRHVYGLDEHGVARAAVEAAARAFDRKLVAPVFAYALLGVPGMLVWTAMDGADAALGSPGIRHGRFGLTAATLDDALNALPARLAGLLLAVAAPFIGTAKGGGAVRAMVRDARKHPSLNMGWPIAAMAGALGLSLGGPHRDGGVVITEAWIGDGRARATPADIGRALALYAVAALILIGLVALLMWGVAGV
ncbi:CobD/CbiB family cobalamin biosynthesis protein [Azospirillum doebereinerae]|uniref:CobD/CbiB family cobalamin biosynthesis protein n=1 Tax=Azospirillum doebereinerae TaxID=92933 RepID=UPI001EE5E3C5|nr:CobD/CbiB family cobalamin biosynthesis protein [Azospirillum doebereinerae]MCG5241994.1 cobalamin biosynthesis protein [Azospirillum doebereinerae]